MQHSSILLGHNRSEACQGYIWEGVKEPSISNQGTAQPRCFWKPKLFQVRGKNSVDGGCACVNCNCITDKTKYFTIPDAAKMVWCLIITNELLNHDFQTLNITTTNVPILHPTSEEASESQIITVILVVALALGVTLTCMCLICRRKQFAFWKQKIAFSALKTPKFPNRKTRVKSKLEASRLLKLQRVSEFFKVMLVCPEITGRENDYMMRISEAMKKSNNTVVCDRWKECFPEAEENLLHWVYEQSKKAEKVMILKVKLWCLWCLKLWCDPIRSLCLVSSYDLFNLITSDHRLPLGQLPAKVWCLWHHPQLLPINRPTTSAYPALLRRPEHLPTWSGIRDAKRPKAAGRHIQHHNRRSAGHWHTECNWWLKFQ